MSEISVIVPVYNTPAAYLRECADSVLRQTFKDFELILVDDGSANGAEALCDEYAAADSRVRVLHRQKNGGVSAARNTGMDAAEGKWLIFLDADDWWEDNTLELLHSRAESEALDVLVFAYFVNTGDSVEEHPCFRGGVRGGYTSADAALAGEMLLGLMDRDRRRRLHLFGACTHLLIRRELTAGDSELRFDTMLQNDEDSLFCLHLWQKAHRMGILDTPLYHYRKAGLSASSRYSARAVENFERVNKAFLDFLREYDKPRAFYEAYELMLMRSYIKVLRFDMFNSDNPAPRAERKRAWKKLLSGSGTFTPLKSAASMKFYGKLYHTRKIYVPLYIASFRLGSFELTGLAMRRE